jgi:alpha-galactosidase
VVKLPTHEAVLGRNQLVLDLCQKEVRDYIVEQVTAILDEAEICYVKWDMNRHIAEAFSSVLQNQGEFYHRYIIGLYEVLTRIFVPRKGERM